MSLFGKKKKAQDTGQEYRTKDFFDCILPGSIKFFANYYIVGDTYRCVWVIREYPPTTEEQAILAQLADRTGVTLRLYHRRVTPVEEKQIVNNAARKNRLMAGDHDITQAMEAEGNLQDVQTLLATMRNNREILLHCSVYMELKAKSMETLEQLQSQIAMELTRAKITVDKLTLRQQEGFLSVLPLWAQPVWRPVRAGAACRLRCQYVPSELFRQDRSQGFLCGPGQVRHQYSG